jgi:hypothetical protein
MIRSGRESRQWLCNCWADYHIIGGFAGLRVLISSVHAGPVHVKIDYANLICEAYKNLGHKRDVQH